MGVVLGCSDTFYAWWHSNQHICLIMHLYFSHWYFGIYCNGCTPSSECMGFKPASLELTASVPRHLVAPMLEIVKMLYISKGLMSVLI